MIIPVARPDISGNEIKYVTDALERGELTYKGNYVKLFEQKFAEENGSKYCLTTANGTVSLHLILAALGIKPGDEVITPTLTYAATSFAISYCGATPVFVDSNRLDYNINPEQIEDKITDKTKAIMAVHLYGHPAQMDRIKEIADKHNLPIVEDCAEAPGSSVNGVKVGNFGVAGSFSWFGNKILAAGEGGAVVTNDEELYKKMKHLANGATVYPYYHDQIGFNYRMSNISAAIIFAQLESFDRYIIMREEIESLYNKYLKGCKNLIFYKDFLGIKPVCWLYTVLADRRDALMNHLKAQGIETRPFFLPNHKLPPYDKDEIFPVAEDIAKRGINLPTFIGLTEEEIRYISDCIREFYR